MSRGWKPPQSDAEKSREAFNHVLDVKRAQAGYANWTALSDGLGLDRNTLYSWRHNPDGIPRKALRGLYRALKYTPEDIFESFGIGGTKGGEAT